jgi:hypothetical protein
MEYQKEKFYIYILSILILVSYFFGFYINEDSAGGGKVDLYDHEWGNIQFFVNNSIFDALSDLRYESSRTPLYLIINKYNIFASTIEGLRISYFVFSLAIPISFFFLLRKIYRNTDVSILLFISTIPLLSPNFRSSAFWANEENLAIFFVIISLIFFIDTSRERKKFSLNNLFIASLASFFSFLAFYSDQKAVFLVIFIYFALITKNDLKFFIIFSFINFIIFIPALYLFYIWGGIVPIESQFRMALNLTGFNILISNIGIYLLPIIFILFIKKELKEYLNFDFFNLVILILISLLLLYSLPIEPQLEGTGIVLKFLSVMSQKLEISWNFVKFLYFFINLIFLFFLLNLFEKKIENLIFFIVFLIIFLSTWFTYKTYVDTLFFILLFGYFKLKDKVKLVNLAYAYSFFIFYFLMLTSSILFRKFVLA